MAKINREKQTVMPQKLLKDLFEYNGETGDWVSKVNRGKVKIGQSIGSLHKSTGYIRIMINYNEYLAHRLAWVYTYGDFPEGKQPFIDHINGNPLDNRIINLRVSSGGENMKNKKMDSRNKSGVTGVRRSETMASSSKIYAVWIASWYNERGKLCHKYFNIETYGEEEAKQLAIKHRAEQIRLLELNHGISYSDRHGK